MSNPTKDFALAPGAVLARRKAKPKPTPEGRILAAIHSGRGLTAAAKEAVDADGLDISTPHVKALIELLQGEIADRKAMVGALGLYLP